MLLMRDIAGKFRQTAKKKYAPNVFNLLSADTIIIRIENKKEFWAIVQTGHTQMKQNERTEKCPLWRKKITLGQA